VMTEVDGPVGFGVGPRLEALDVLSVLRAEPDAPAALRDSAIRLAGRIFEAVGAATAGQGEPTARHAIDSGAAAQKFEAIVDAQGRRELPPEAPHRSEHRAVRSGRLTAVDCRAINALAKLAGAPAHPAAGLRLLCRPGDDVAHGQPLLEIHAQSPARLAFAEDFAAGHPEIFDVVG